MVTRDYDYQKIKIKYHHFQISYTRQKGRYTGGCGNKNKEIVRSFKILDILLSLLSSILSILKSVFCLN